MIHSVYNHTTGLEECFDRVMEEITFPITDPSLGVDRLMLALICSAYAEDEVW
jgi:glycyl-tRNA synthetase (class II)